MLTDRAERSQNASRILLERLQCQKSLHSFIKNAWPYIEGRDKPFFDSWAIGAICEHLEAVVLGQIPKLGINIPPRMGKTNIVSISWPAWTFLTYPNAQFLFASYAQRLSLAHSRKCRDLINSEWYQSRWGGIFKLKTSTMHEFTTDKYGHRMATSVGASGTGFGANFLVMDDPNNAQDGESKTRRESTNDWVSSTWSSRLNPGKPRGEVLVQQRINALDVSGLLSKDPEWVWLVLPMEYEKSRKCKTIILPSSKGKVWEDPRKEEGELLCPEYITKKDLESKKIIMGSQNYAGQYQQRPSPEEGGIIKKAYFKVWTDKELPKIHYIVESWDTALTEKETSDFSACSTWGVFVDKHFVNSMILLSVWKGRLNYAELLPRAVRLYKNCYDTGLREIEPNKNNQPDIVLIEDKAAGHSLSSDMVNKGIRTALFPAKRFGDKSNRLNLASPYLENGRVYVLGDKNGIVIPEQAGLIQDCCEFPNGEHDDTVDTLSQAVLYLTKIKSMITHSMDIDFTRDKVSKEQMPKKWSDEDYRKNKGVRK